MPHLAALVERHQDDAFRLIGINTGDDERAFRAGAEELDVTWPCAWQGPREAPIARQYRVSAYPTLYVLDREGRIRYRNVQGPALDRAVATLLEESVPPDPR